MGHVLVRSQELGLYAGRNRRFLGRRATQFCFLKTTPTTWWFRKDRREAKCSQRDEQELKCSSGQRQRVLHGGEGWRLVSR